MLLGVEPKPVNMPKPARMLCLHGAGSNNDITQLQMQGLNLTDRMECVYLQAPHMTKTYHPGLDLISEGPFYTWADKSKALSDQEDQWDESLQFMAKFCKANGPFAGVYGFSQSAAIITNFSHPKIWRDRFKMKQCPWKFVILACGTGKHHMTIPMSTTIEMPSLHIFGKKDDKHLSNSKMLAGYWDHSQKMTHTHGRGHEIDMQISKRETEMMLKLNKFLDERLEDGGCDIR